MPSSIRTAFPQLAPELLDVLELKAEINQYPTGSLLEMRGAHARQALLVTRGIIKIYRVDDHGAEYFIYYLRAGEACALSMFPAEEGARYRLRGKVVEELRMVHVPVEYVEKWMLDYPSWYQFVMDTYRKCFEELLGALDRAAFLSLEERLLCFLRRQREIYNDHIITVNHTEMAQELNSSREVISRLMKKLAERGKVNYLRPQQVEIISLDF